MNHFASNSIELLAAISKASSGDVIVLTAGSYGSVVIANKTFTPALTIVAVDRANPPLFSKINISQCVGIHMVDIRLVFTPWDGVKEWDAAFKASDSSDIHVIGSQIEGLNVPDAATWGVPANSTPGTVDAGVIQGWPTGRGAFFFRCRDVAFSNNKVTGFSHGVNTTQVDDLRFEGNEISGCRKVPINGEDVKNVRIANNFFHDLNPWNFSAKGDHGDFIHFWTRPGQARGLSNIVIEDNHFEQGGGNAPLGIYLDDNGRYIGFIGVVIRNNIMNNSNGQAIRMEEVSDLVIVNNTLVGEPDQYAVTPKILLDTGVKRAKIHKNIMMGFSGAAMSDLVGNNIDISDNLQVTVSEFDSIFKAPWSPALDASDYVVIPGSRGDGYGATPIGSNPSADPTPAPTPAPNPVPVPTPVPDDPATEDDEPEADDQEDDGEDDAPETGDEPGEGDDAPETDRPLRSIVMGLADMCREGAYLTVSEATMIDAVAALTGGKGDREVIAEMCRLLRAEAGLTN